MKSNLIYDTICYAGKAMLYGKQRMVHMVLLSKTVASNSHTDDSC